MGTTKEYVETPEARKRRFIASYRRGGDGQISVEGGEEGLIGQAVHSLELFLVYPDHDASILAVAGKCAGRKSSALRKWLAAERLNRFSDGRVLIRMTWASICGDGSVVFVIRWKLSHIDREESITGLVNLHIKPESLEKHGITREALLDDGVDSRLGYCFSRSTADAIIRAAKGGIDDTI